MDIQERIAYQRIQHIVDSYQLEGDDGEAFSSYLAQLMEVYPQPLLELALTEAIVKGWSQIPMQKGMPFIHKVCEQLRIWQPELESSLSKSLIPSTALGAADAAVAYREPVDCKAIETQLTPAQFEHITGLDASAVFDADGNVLGAQPMEL